MNQPEMLINPDFDGKSTSVSITGKELESNKIMEYIGEGLKLECIQGNPFDKLSSKDQADFKKDLYSGIQVSGILNGDLSLELKSKDQYTFHVTIKKEGKVIDQWIVKRM